MTEETKVPYFVPVSSHVTRRKETFLDVIIDRFPKMVQWLLTVYKKEGVSIRTRYEP